MVRTTTVSKLNYSNYLKKAQEFYETMQDSLAKGKWNAAGLNAIHSGISATDSILVFFHGLRSTSPKHDDIIKLIRSLINHKDIKTVASHLRNLIHMKNIVEYEERLIDKHEAVTLSKHATRLLGWVKSMLPN